MRFPGNTRGRSGAAPTLRSKLVAAVLARRGGFDPTSGIETMKELGRIHRVRNEYLEKMAAAYLKETSLPPGRACLCEQTKDGVTRWWFEERQEPSDGD